MESSNSQQCCRNETAPCMQPGQIPSLASICMGQWGCEGGGGVARGYCCPDRLEDEPSVLVHSWKKQGQGQLGKGHQAQMHRNPKESPMVMLEMGESMLHYTQQSREEGQGDHPAIHTLRVEWKEKGMKYGTFRREYNDFVRCPHYSRVHQTHSRDFCAQLSCSLTGERPEEHVSKQTHGEACSRCVSIKEAMQILEQWHCNMFSLGAVAAGWRQNSCTFLKE